jgi:hypothetical protein
VGAAEILDLDLGVAVAIVNDLEGPRLHVLLDGRVIEAATDQTPKNDELASKHHKSPSVRIHT